MINCNFCHFSSVLVPFEAITRPTKHCFLTGGCKQKAKLGDFLQICEGFEKITVGKSPLQNHFHSKPKPTEETTAVFKF